MSQLRSVSFQCRGHADVRGSHPKSVEFTPDTAITARATCVLGVSAEIDPPALTGFRGPLRVTIAAGARSDTVHAVANPGFEPGGSVILRTSRHASPDTFAVGADRGAAQLDRDLVAELAQPGATATVTVVEEPAPGRPDGGGLTVVTVPRLHRDYLAPPAREAVTCADAVLANDAPAAYGLLAEAGLATTVHDPSDAHVRARLDAGEQLAYLATTASGHGPLAGGSLAAVAAAASEANAALRILPDPAPHLAAVAAAGPEASPYTLAGPHGPAQQDRLQLLRGAVTSGATAVWGEPVPAVEGALADIESILEQGIVRMCVSVATHQGLWLRGTLAQLRQQWNGLGRPPGEVMLVVTVPAQEEEPASPGQRDAFLAALLAEGVPARTIAQALASLPGHDYRSQYRRVLALKSGGET